MGARVEVVGQRYGRLHVIKSIRLPNGRWGCECRCDCGATATVDQGHLRSGNTTSCGCHKRSVLPISTTKHGHGREGKQTRTYSSWKSMRMRCLNARNSRYKDYGGRGVSIHPSWDRFETFLSDMGECPDGLTLDRIDTNGNYEPGNCRWATYEQQASNQRTTRLLTYNGETLSMSAWARRLGLTPSSLHERLQKMSVEAALSTPKMEAPHGETIQYEMEV